MFEINPVTGLLIHCFDRKPDQNALIVYDQRCVLSKELFKSYAEILTSAKTIDFDKTEPTLIFRAFEDLSVGDLVVLIQSDSFRLNDYRLRVELFNRGLKVIEHPHLAIMNTPSQCSLYLQSLIYDVEYYRSVGPSLKFKLDNAHHLSIQSKHLEQLLCFEGGFEDAKLNVGDYTSIKNVGGQFPIGEVFTEAKTLESVSGAVKIFAYGSADFLVRFAQPSITLHIEKGCVVHVLDQTDEFGRILDDIRQEEGQIWVRELGLGLNRAFTRDHRVNDVGTYERMCGVHLSLGAKHSLYKKPQFTRSRAKYHVDVFVDTDCVHIDSAVVYQKDKWIL